MRTLKKLWEQSRQRTQFYKTKREQMVEPLFQPYHQQQEYERWLEYPVPPIPPNPRPRPPSVIV
jgi:antibiotic biosynthesis monooxygenase (ABM) superfamily enzyme